MEISVHQRLQASWEQREGVTHASQLEFCLVFSLQIIFQAMPPLRSKSAHSQVPQLCFKSGPWCLCGCGSVQIVRRLLTCKQRVRNAISVKHWSSSCQVCWTCYAAPVTVNCHCLSLNGCRWILTDSISRPQHTDKVNQVARNKLPELLLATTVFSFYAVVIWSDLLGDLQYCQDTLSWHPPNISDCSAGEWREAPKANQCCLLWCNVCYGYMHRGKTLV